VFCSPHVMVPRPIRLTCTSESPSLRYSIELVLLICMNGKR
jgi:hypothetical protein